MKKILITLWAVAFANIANAQFSGTQAPLASAGGFDGPGAVQAPTTVKAALAARDDTPVVLVGQIVNSLGDEKYTFRDSTGEVIVEIDDEDWRGVRVTPENTVELYGEVDKEVFESTKIDVKSVVVK